MRNRFWIVLFLITVYGFLMALLRPSGVSLIKIAITLLPWLSFYFSFIYLINNYPFFKRKVPSFAFALFIILVLLNFMNIIRGALTEGGITTTVFGNPYNSLALLTPFAMCFGLAVKNLAKINRFFIYSTAIGIVAAILAMAIIPDANTFLSSALLLISPSIFMIGTIAYHNRKNKLIIFIGSLLLFGYLGVLTGSRATILRILLLYLSNMVVVFHGKVKHRWLLAITMCTLLLLPYLMVIFSFNSGQSVFSTATQYLQSEFGSMRFESENAITKGDTRTFLYQEVFTDLERNGQLLFGKGSNGTYFSPYFQRSKGDSDTRLTVEVGLLALLLKGGIVAVILNLALLYMAISLSFFRAKNQYVRWVGFMLIIHTLILFVENLVAYDMYNFSIWFFVGVCLSKEIRAMNNMEIQSTFNCMPKIVPKVTW